MKDILGIIAEYNPMHRGHVHHLHLALKETQCKYVIVAMSGNFVQRGEPAIVSKWVRAEMAVLAGADLVVEIPARYALQSAEGFAQAGVELLKNCGATHISFGSEAGNLEGLKRLAHWLEQPQSQRNIRLKVKEGISYAAAVERAAKQPFPQLAPSLRSPNNILAIEYLRALTNTSITAHTVQREEEYVPASSIRFLIAQGQTEEAMEHIPPNLRVLLADSLATEGPVFIEDLSQGIFYALISRGARGIATLPACSEGLENRLIRAANRCRSLPELLKTVKTKRYPWTRIQRLLMQALLQLSAAPELPGSIPYSRVLAVSPRGKVLLSRLGRGPLPLLYSSRAVCRLDPGARRAFEEETRSEHIYHVTQNLKTT